MLHFLDSAVHYDKVIPQHLLAFYMFNSFFGVCMSANHSYLQPEGWITKGAAQRDRPNAFERRLRLPPNGHE